MTQEQMAVRWRRTIAMRIVDTLLPTVPYEPHPESRWPASDRVIHSAMQIIKYCKQVDDVESILKDAGV